jgi:D-xylose transport system substrate-binding protein
MGQVWTLKGLIALVGVGVLATGGVAACNNDESGAAAKTPKVGVILPDSATSNRWDEADRKYLKAAFDAAGMPAIISNAQGDKNQFQTLADQMLTQNVTVLMIVNLDSGTGKAVLDKARSKGVATIDYDRLTINGGADYYVSFDNVKVGELQGQGLVKCLTDKGVKSPVVAELNGSPTDNNATLFKQGYDSVLQPKFDANEYKKGPDQPVPDWNNTQAGTIFEQMLTQTTNKIDGVLAANDGLANATIAALKRQKMRIPVTGQDATKVGLQNILAGDQCMTVYKAVKTEVAAASELAIALAKGEKKPAPTTVKDPESGREVPSVLLLPKAIYKENVKDVIADGYQTKEAVCAGTIATYCAAAGIN